MQENVDAGCLGRQARPWRPHEPAAACCLCFGPPFGLWTAPVFQQSMHERGTCMARVTVEDCIDKVDNRFELVLLAGHRARRSPRARAITVDRDNDKNPVVALREIADETLSPDDLKEDLIHSLQKHVEVDEPEADGQEITDQTGAVAAAADVDARRQHRLRPHDRRRPAGRHRGPGAAGKKRRLLRTVGHNFRPLSWRQFRSYLSACAVSMDAAHDLFELAGLREGLRR